MPDVTQLYQKPSHLRDLPRTGATAQEGRRNAPVRIDLLVYSAIILLAFLFRVWDVGARAMHLDESTVAWFGWQLLTGHGYSYDPVYHGPFQHEMLALIFLLFGSSQTTARLPAVMLGTALVALPWAVRDYMGRLGAITGCFLLAISPSFVYFGRFERDDTYMEFFTFLLVVLALRFLRDRKPWQLYALIISFALAFATKESIYIVAFIFGSFLLLWLAGSKLRRRAAPAPIFDLHCGAVRWQLLVPLAIVLLVAILLTPVMQLYLPVPLLAFIILAIATIAASASWPVRTSSSVKHGIFSSRWKSHWINALTIAAGIILLMYSTFGTNLNGLWDQAHPFFNTNHACQYPLAFNLDACRKDISGGLFYWLSQHKVARGGQPWFYYLLIYGLYEQIAIVFGLFAIVKVFVSRTMTLRVRTLRMFLGYWAIMALIIYSWAGEKFPWLGIHPLLPLTLLAGVGISDLLLARRHIAIARLGLVVAAVLIILELHNTYELNYVNGANPVEMMVYVQSAPDTVSDANLIEQLSDRATQGTTLPVTIDSTDAWPFAWYLRNEQAVAYPSATQTVKPPYVTNPIIIVDQNDAQTLKLPRSWATTYRRRLRRLDWWFPEDYKTWTWAIFRQKVLSGNSWKAIWSWQIARQPFGPRDGSWYYLYIKKGYFPPF